MSNPVIFSYRLQGDGSGIKLENEDIAKELKSNNPAWAHLDVSNKAVAQKWLKANTKLDALTIEGLVAAETRPRLQESEKGSLLILRGVNLNPNSNPEDMVSIRMWIDEHKIITLQRRGIKAIREIETNIVKGKGPSTAADFMVSLSVKLIEKMEPVIQNLDDDTDNLEDRIIGEPDNKFRHEIIELRRESIQLRRYLNPQRDVISRLRTSEQSWLTATHKRRLHEIYDRLSRYVEELDSIRERSQVIQDELQNNISDKINKNMYVLSVIAAIFLPLGFLTGLLGINVGGIPGAENGNSFYIFCLVLICLVIGQIALFKKMKWF
jgi:zinc transporter